MPTLLPPTSSDLGDDATHPYFLWWTETSVGEFRSSLADPDPETRAYWMASLLREANTRDVWLFVTPEEIRRNWRHLVRFLGRSRQMWAFLLQIDDSGWPPRQRND